MICLLTAIFSSPRNDTGFAARPGCPCKTFSDLPNLTNVYEGYGVGHCKAWDEGLATFGCAQNARGYCSAPWCYIDEVKCKQSNNTYEESLVVGGKGLFFSYDSCGASSSALIELEATHKLDLLRGKTLRAAFPGLTAWAHW